MLAAVGAATGRRWSPAELARTAYQVERIDLKIEGGMQDQYAAAYGGLNFIEFAGDDEVEVRPLAVAGEVLEALERSLLLAWSGDSRTDDGILRRQVDGVLLGSERSLASLGALKALAEAMRDALLGGDLATFAEGLRQGWEHKRQLATGIATPAGGAVRGRPGRRAAGGKVLGAGGGGFMLFAGPPERRARMVAALEAAGAPARRSASTCTAPTPPTGPGEVSDIGSYLASSAAVAAALAERPGVAAVERAARLVADALAGGGQVLFCGNGGSAADAQHLAAELVGHYLLERPAYRAVALTTDTSVLTAVGNDYGYADVFARQVEGLGRPGDVLVASRPAAAPRTCSGRRPPPRPPAWPWWRSSARPPRRWTAPPTSPCTSTATRRAGPAGPHHHRPRPLRLGRAAAGARMRAVFLDRDGTLVEEVPYLHDPARVVLLRGGRPGRAGRGRLRPGGGDQPGRGGPRPLRRGGRRGRPPAPGRAAGRAGVRLDAVLHCPHHPEGTVPGYARACRCRKPGPGMLEAAAGRLGLDLAASFMIGNHPTDVGAAVAAGVTPLFVTTGRAAGRPPPPGVAVVADLEAAARAVLEAGGGAGGRESSQARSGRDGAGLARDAGWSRATAP